MKISLFKNYKSVSKPPLKLDVLTVLHRIRDGKHKEIIDKIRESETKSVRTLLKKEIPCAVFSGYLGEGIEKVNRKSGDKYVSYREDKSLTEHSGLCVIDIDDLGADEISLYKEELIVAFNNIYSIFISPSGNGLKVIFRIPSVIKDHRAHYKAILADIGELGLDCDTTSINEARLCFESYDPDIYINEDAIPFTDLIVDEEVEPIIPLSVKKGELTDYKKLNIAAKMIDKAPDGYKHHTLIRASYLMGGFISSGKVNEDDAVSMLRARISARNIIDREGAFETIADGIAKGKLKPIYEIEEIEEQFQNYLSKEEFKSKERGFSFLGDSNKIDIDLNKYLRDGENEGLSTRFDSLDNHFKFKENSFNIILGHDGVGKSFFIWYLSVIASTLHGWKWIIHSPENKTYRIKKIMIDFILGERSERVSKVKFKQAKAFVDDHFYFIRKDKEHTLFDILKYGEILCNEDSDIKGLMIDPYNSLKLDYQDKGRGLSGYEYHLKCATNMRIFSEKSCAVYLVSHSVTGSRRGNFDSDGILMRPSKNDIDGGAIWANRCDDFMVIHRKVKSEDEWMWTEVHMDKVKDVETGGGVTYDEPVKFKLNYFSDFVDDGGKSALDDFRIEFFNTGVQAEIPLVTLEEAF